MNTKQKSKISLEPALEEIASGWSPAKRREMARIFSRWARELRVTANALDVQSRGTFRRRLTVGIPLRKAKLN